MADSKKLRSKIQSTINIKKITNALEIFSTIKLQKTKKDAVHIREAMLSLINLLVSVGSDAKVFDEVELYGPKKTLVLVLGSDKGLCGSLNTTLFKKVDSLFADNQDNVDMFVIGKKTKDFFARRKYNIIGELFLGDDVSVENFREVISFLENIIYEYKYANIYISYNVFKNTMKYVPVMFPIFPLAKDNLYDFLDELEQEDLVLLSKKKKEADKKIEFTLEAKIEPSRPEIQKVIKKMIVSYLVYGAFLQNKTSEFAARMLAMKGAKDNADTQIDELTLAYNKARQDAITKEIIEIAGAKAIVAG